MEKLFVLPILQAALLPPPSSGLPPFPPPQNLQVCFLQHVHIHSCEMQVQATKSWVRPGGLWKVRVVWEGGKESRVQSLMQLHMSRLSGLKLQGWQNNHPCPLRPSSHTFSGPRSHPGSDMSTRKNEGVCWLVAYGGVWWPMKYSSFEQVVFTIDSMAIPD